MMSVVMAMPRTRRPNSLDQIEIFLGGVSAMHRLQNSVRAGLQRQMHVLDQLRQGGERADQIVAKTDRMRRSETQAFQAVDLVDGFEQLHERTLVVDASEIRAGHKDSRSGRASVTSFTPRETRSRTSRTISSIERLRSAPRVCGTMQNVQCMLQPCMIETNAVACFGASTCSRIVACEPASSADVDDREARIVHSRRVRAFLSDQLPPRNQPRDEISACRRPDRRAADS